MDIPVRLPALPERLRRRPLRKTLTIGLPLCALGALATIASPGDYRLLTAPVCASILIAAIFFTILWDRDRRPPLFEAGSLCMAASVIYSIYPILGFMAANLQWTELTDNRLLAYRFDTGAISAFGWWYVIYLASFATAYLAVRGRKSVRATALKIPHPALFVSLLTLLAVDYAVKWGMYLVYGLNLDVSYAELAQQGAPTVPIPYVLSQLTTVVFGTILLLKQAVVLILLCRWRSVLWRTVLLLWIGLEVALVSIRLGARSNAVLLLLAIGLLYHRVVKPLKARAILVGGAAVLIGFLLLGALRSGFGAQHALTGTNEFQSLFTTAFDIQQRRNLGGMTVPWQVYFTDLYLLIPSQLLPFEKVDPSEWYLDVIGQRNTGIGYMFGVMAQAAVGFGRIELAVRGAVLGLVLALLHRWYVRHSTGYWATLFYLFVSIWTYYTFRATTFWFVHFIVYEFVPVMLAAKLLELLFQRTRVASSKHE
jgi:hypothetical protein